MPRGSNGAVRGEPSRTVCLGWFFVLGFTERTAVSVLGARSEVGGVVLARGAVPFLLERAKPGKPGDAKPWAFDLPWTRQVSGCQAAEGMDRSSTRPSPDDHSIRPRACGGRALGYDHAGLAFSRTSVQDRPVSQPIFADGPQSAEDRHDACPTDRLGWCGVFPGIGSLSLRPDSDPSATADRASDSAAAGFRPAAGSGTHRSLGSPGSRTGTSSTPRQYHANARRAGRGD